MNTKRALATFLSLSMVPGLSSCEPGTEPEETETLSQPLTVGQMDCLSGTCGMRNMPLFSQTDPTVDVDVIAGSGVGCYDASITTLLTTALANRTGQSALVQRTSTWNQIQPGNNGGNPPMNTSKVIEQYSQQMRWAKEMRPMYFHEMLSDFASSGQVLRSPAGCNPRIYPQCDLYTVARPDFVGASFRDFTSGNSHVTNDNIKTLMNHGFAVMIAYRRYAPKKVWDPALGGNKMTFTSLGQHKVVFSGYQNGFTYPLRLNDVGNGQRYDVTLSADVSARPSYDGVRTSDVKKWEFPNGLKSQTTLLYNPSQAPDPQVNFVEHVDALSLSLPPGGPARQVFSGGWGTGWSTLMPFTFNGAPHQLAYNITTGAVHFDRFYPNANGVETKWSWTWGSGFSHFSPFYVGNYPYFIAYNQTNGEVHFDTFPSNLQGPIIKGIKNWGAGFTSVTPFLANGQNHFLIYNKNTGAVRVERVNNQQSGSDTVWSGTWSTGFTDFFAHDKAGQPYLVAYNASNGVTHYDRFFSGLNGVEVLGTGNLGSGRAVYKLDFPGAAQFLSYPSSGSGQVQRLMMDGKSATQVWSTSLLGSATSAVPFVQDGKSYLVLYNKNNGSVRGYQMSLF